MRIKSPLCCQLHHNPIDGWAYAFQSELVEHRFVSLLFGDSVVALGIELSATRLSAGFGQPALDYHQSRAPRSRTETLLFPKQACFHLHLYPRISRQSERQASLRSDQVVASSPYGNRTHLTALKERHPLPIDERAMLCAYLERSGPGGARILVCGSSDRRYAVSATSP